MTSGNTVNPLLGAKVLPSETDLALPGFAWPFILSRTPGNLPDEDACLRWAFSAPTEKRLLISAYSYVMTD